MHASAPFSSVRRSARRLGSALAFVATLAVLAGCASGSYGPGSLTRGATTVEVQQRMGAPTGRYELPDGRQRLEFARGPFGKHTFMLDFDAAGRLESSEQVLNDNTFMTIQPGQTRDHVLRTIGHPSDVRYLSYQKRDLWSYRYDAIFCQWFQVSLDTAGRVVEAGYGPDPLCEANDRNFY